MSFFISINISLENSYSKSARVERLKIKRSSIESTQILKDWLINKELITIAVNPKPIARRIEVVKHLNRIQSNESRFPFNKPFTRSIEDRLSNHQISVFDVNIFAVVIQEISLTEKAFLISWNHLNNSTLSWRSILNYCTIANLNQACW